MEKQILSDLKKNNSLVEGMENDIKKWDKNSKRHSIDWSNGKWRLGVISHYKELQKEFEKSALMIKNITGKASSILNEGLKIELIGLVENDDFRTYSLLTPWMLDMIIEFRVDLDDIQIKRLKEAGASVVSPLTDEKSKWVIAGTSLVGDNSRDTLLIRGKIWADDVYVLASRILFKLHDMEGKNG